MDYRVEDIFGENVFQDSNYLIIQKADLTRLTLAQNNSAEQLLVAILFQLYTTAYGNIVDEMLEDLIDEIGENIGYDNSNTYSKLEIIFHQRQYLKKNNLPIIFDIFTIDIYLSGDALPGFNIEVNKLEY